MGYFGSILRLLGACMEAAGVPDVSPGPLGVREGLQCRKGDLMANYGSPFFCKWKGKSRY